MLFHPKPAKNASLLTCLKAPCRGCSTTLCYLLNVQLQLDVGWISDGKPDIFVVACWQNEINAWLFLARYHLKGTNTNHFGRLHVIDRCEKANKQAG